jgi:outer membrane immunogenic protein
MSQTGGGLMKPLFLGSVALLALAAAGPAVAADVAVKSPVYKAAPTAVATVYNWTGLYVGGHVGYLWGLTTFTDNGVVTESNAATNGVVGGVLGGYNWQSGALVLGFEGDFGWTKARGTGVQQVTEINFYDIHWTSHVRGRAGYASGPWLVFVAGGLSLADLTIVKTFQNSIPSCTMRGGFYAGYSIGGGMEYAFSSLVSARAEYLYDEFGKKDYVMAVNDVYRVNLRGHTLRGSINFKLWPN